MSALVALTFSGGTGPEANKLARAIARRLRRASRSAVAAKPIAEMAMQPAACAERARAHDAAIVVCGHAHAFQDVSLPEGPRWLVVDAFGGET